jgi:hypothetical protein
MSAAPSMKKAEFERQPVAEFAAIRNGSDGERRKRAGTPEGTILDMKAFSITASNQVRAFASEQEAPAGEAAFSTAEQLAVLVQEGPIARLVEVWNQLPGAKQIRKFTDRKGSVRRLWQAVRRVAAKVTISLGTAGNARGGIDFGLSGCAGVASNLGTALVTDARGVLLPQNFTTGLACDIGAYQTAQNQVQMTFNVSPSIGGRLQRCNQQFPPAHQFGGRRVAFHAAELLDGLDRPLGLTLGTGHRDGDFFDDQAGIFELGFFGSELPG